jgi:hypothetical protein
MKSTKHQQQQHQTNNKKQALTESYWPTNSSQRLSTHNPPSTINKNERGSAGFILLGR